MGLFRRQKVWWMSFSYQGRQIRRSTGATDRRLADAVLAKVKVQIVEGRFFERAEEQTRTFGELMDRLETEHIPKLASQQSYKGYVKRLRAFFGNRTLAEITPKLIAGYKSARYALKKAPATINRELATLKKAFNLAVREWEWCRENPVSRVSMEREHNKRDRWLTDEEEERLLKECPAWLREIVLFALHTGMRMGEILELTWRSVDLGRRTVTVFRSKNGERRTLPLNQTVLAMLKEKAKIRSLQTDLLFPSTARTRIDTCNLDHTFRAAVERATIEGFRFHDLRHTFATRLVQGGADLYQVQRLLGHKSPMMTQRYAHHYPESLRSGVEILDRRRSVSTNLAQSGVEPGRAVCVSV